jgi:hypothetical protein
MNLCLDCEAAARDPHGIGVTHKGRLCCIARSIMSTPRRIRRQAADAMCAGMTPLDAHAVRVRCEELLEAQRGRAAA